MRHFLPTGLVSRGKKTKQKSKRVEDREAHRTLASNVDASLAAAFSSSVASCGDVCSREGGASVTEMM